MLLLICRILYTLPVAVIAFLALYKIWTTEVDLLGLFRKPTEMILTKEKSFSVSHTWASGDSAPLTWYLANDSITGVYCEMLIHFTNLKTTPVSIMSYWVEQETSDGKWELVTLPFGPDFGTFFSGRDLTNVKEIKFVTFDSIVSGKNVGPNETVTGTIFLTKKRVGRLKFSFRNPAGETEFTYINSIATGGWPTQSISMISTGRTADISRYPQATKPTEPGP